MSANEDTTSGPSARTRAEGAAEQLKAEAQERIDKVKADVDRAKKTVEEVRTEVSTAVDDRRGGPATSVEDAEQKAATLRAGIERDLADLQAKVPDGEEVSDRLRSLAITAGAVSGTVTVVGFLLGRRSSRRAREKDLTEQAEALAAVLARAEQIGAERLGTEADDGGSSGRWVALALAILAGAGGAGALLWKQRQAAELDVEDLWGNDPQA